MSRLFAFLAVILAVNGIGTGTARSETCDIYEKMQTSASLMIRFSECRIKNAASDPTGDAEKRHLLLYDVFIKASSYSLLNKVFFWLSILFGVKVLLWPSLSIILKDRLETSENWHWIRSATVQTTVTGLAALMFAFYSQYKDKQTQAEGLMRHVLYSQEATQELSQRVAVELARIDRGFSFSSAIGMGGADSAGPGSS
ncbi:MAG: hypothetical protein AAGL24_10740 [Pseudomonadota bacterium]